MADNSMYRLIVRYTLVYPMLVVVPLGVLTMFRSRLGMILLFVAAMLGTILFAAFNRDTRAERAIREENPARGFDPQQDAPESLVSGLGVRLMAFGIGLFIIAGIVLLVVYLPR